MSELLNRQTKRNNINTETDKLKETILNQKIDRFEQTFLQRITDLEFQLRKLQE